MEKEKSELLWKKVISEADNVPALPEIVNKVLEQIENPKSTPQDFEEIISKDAVLTAKVLKVSNSAYYGYSRRIDTIRQAIIILGLDTLKSLVIAASAYASLKNPSEGYGLSKDDLWRHSLAVAVGARLIAKQFGFKDVERFFVGGLLHDIGKILLGPHIINYIYEIRNIAKMSDTSFNLVEKQILGFNHCDVGAELANHWKLPSLFYDITLFHHTPYECVSENSKIVEIIHIADILVYSYKIGLGLDGQFYKPASEIFEKYNIDKKAKEELGDKIYKNFRELERTIR
jgi:putative nucleotidyltransferase with HDIG domain